MTSSDSPTTAPPDDGDETYHVHDDGSWEWGALCPLCTTAPIAAPDKVVNFAIHHLKDQNKRGVTVREMRREIEDGARAEGNDIMRV